MYEIEDIITFYYLLKDIELLGENIFSTELSYHFNLLQYQTVEGSIDVSVQNDKENKSSQMNIKIFLEPSKEAPEAFTHILAGQTIPDEWLNKNYKYFETEINKTIHKMIEQEPVLKDVLQKEHQLIELNQYVDIPSVYDAYLFERGYKLDESGFQVVPLKGFNI